MKTVARFRTAGVALVAAATLSLAVAPAPAEAAPDIDGAVSALIDLPFYIGGDVMGAGGLMIAALGGGAGDIVALVDNNEYSSILLRGLLSTPIKRLSAGLSQLSTGAMEGMRDDDFERFPQSTSTYTGSDGWMKHCRTFLAGLGATGLVVTDALSNTGLFLTRAVGADNMAGDLAGWQDGMRDDWVGKATPGAMVEKTMLFK